MPLDTVMPGAARFGLVAPVITAMSQSGFSNDRSRHIQKPLNTTVTKAEQYLIAPTLIQYHQEQTKSEVRGQSMEKPLNTVDSSPRYGLVTSNLCVLRNNQDGKPLDEPMPTIATSPGHFAEVRTFLIKYYGQGIGQNINMPLDTIVSKDRFGLVSVYGVDYAITDIGLRMLTPRELYNAQGFPPDYKIDIDVNGKAYSKSKQVARCGNAVPPPFAEALVRANLPEMCGKKVETMEELERLICV